MPYTQVAYYGGKENARRAMKRLQGIYIGTLGEYARIEGAKIFLTDSAKGTLERIFKKNPALEPRSIDRHIS